MPPPETPRIPPGPALQADEARYLALAQALCQPGALDGPQPLVANTPTGLRLYNIEDSLCLTSRNDTLSRGSYVCSLHTGLIAYAAEELAKVPSPLARALLKTLIRLFDRVLTRANIDKVLAHNNLLLSTNLYSTTPWSKAALAAHIQACAAEYPGHALLFRSLNPRSNGPLMQSLVALGCALVPSRQVYIAEPAHPAFRQSRDFRADQRLLAGQKRYALCAHTDIYEADYPRIAELYRLLYVDKYSRYNPVFTTAFIRATHQAASMDYVGLRNREGALDGVSAFYDRGGVSTAPLVGYDTAQPQSYGLYRMLLAWSLKRGREKGLLVNLSSGVPGFKKLRGAQPCIEYSAVYTRHLTPGLQKNVWTLLGWTLNKVAVPVMRRYGL